MSTVAKGIRKQLGDPDKITKTAKGDIETWVLDGGNINYRNFSSSGGSMDCTIDFSKALQQEYGFKSYHAKH